MAKPVKEFRAGSIKGSVFQNEKTSRDNKTKYFDYSSNIVKSYKDGDEWKETTSFFEDDLADLLVVTAECQRYIKLEAKKK